MAVNLSKLSKSEWNSELPAGFLIICDVSMFDDCCTIVASAVSSSREYE